MSYSTQRMLTDVQGKPIPQIYDPNSDRFLPLTTEVYREVSDTAVKTELELVKAEIKAVKEKLNGTLSTQLTGSIVDVLIEKTVKVADFGAINSNRVYFNSNGRVEWRGSNAPFDIRQYKKVLIDLTNNTNQPLTYLRGLYYIEHNRGVSVSSSVQEEMSNEVVPVGSRAVKFNNVFYNNAEYFGGFALYGKFLEDPTEGEVSYRVVGIR